MASANASLHRALFWSGLVHAVVFTIGVVGLPIFSAPRTPPDYVIPIDVVNIGAVTQTKVSKPKPVVPEAKPQPRQEPKPAPKPPAAAPEKPVAPAEKPAPKPKPTPPAPKVSSDEFANNILRSLTPAPAAAAVNQFTDPNATEETPPAPNLGDTLSISQMDAVRRQISQCWNVPAGARDAHNLIVELQITMNPDATVADVQVVDKARYASDPFFRAAAESGVRAVLNPRCSPLLLPLDKYDSWRRFTLTFDPSYMITY